MTALADSSASSRRPLLALLTAAFYSLFTLLPDSSSQMVSWFWVAFWQMGLVCPVLWLLSLIGRSRKFQGLGNRLDWISGALVLDLLLSTLLAEFPNQARWYSWAAICILAALYALNYWLQTPRQRYQLLTWQGYLSLAFIGLSLFLWSSQTLLPELARLQDLKPYGVDLPFDFSVLELRNWAPIGHQNYVAGYLLLALPLLVGLGYLQTGWRRWLWFIGTGLGLLDLYTTSSRGGWLGLMLLVLVSFGVLLWRSSIPRLWLSAAGVVTVFGLILLVLANNRLRALLSAAFSGQVGGELGFRTITAAAGWHIGLSHPLFGAGPGSIPLLYQKYRPAWAGREAELVYQLHSTPMQIWAELGLIGILSGFVAIALFIYLGIRWLRTEQAANSDRILFWSLWGGLLAYGIISLTDYQLDNLCISGMIVIDLAVLASIYRQQESGIDGQTSQVGSQASSAAQNPKLFSYYLPLGSFGLLFAITIWLIPIHRAWMLSSQGFAALNQATATVDAEKKLDGIKTFEQQLKLAHQLAPWEPYYPYQLGWKLGDLSLQVGDPQRSLTDGITWFQKAIAISPYQEFGHTNLAWLHILQQDPKAALQEFVKSAQLVPAKRGVFYGLGYTLLQLGKPDLATEAFVLEALRDPMLMTSPVWRSPRLNSLYSNLLTQLDTRYTTLLQPPSAEALQSSLHRCRGALRWWMGNLAAAHTDLETAGTPTARRVLELAMRQSVKIDPEQTDATPGDLAITAWLDPAQRTHLLQKAWILRMGIAPPPELLQEMVTGMTRSTSFDQWLKQNPPIRSYRRDRVGFGVLSRHIDGPAPADFLTVTDNVAMNTFLEELFPSYTYDKALDLPLQVQRDALLKQITP
ncbi:MAG: O-antigen ligase family protein [Scytolyngbya sp. HA4215-MV1]|nr:O-antigen ligase family protein [Scytolyngbya sp. HA4215-MV1]